MNAKFLRLSKIANSGYVDFFVGWMLEAAISDEQKNSSLRKNAGRALRAIRAHKRRSNLPA